MKKLDSTPKLDGFTIPFEGDQHAGTMILLPYREDTWREKAAPAIHVFLQLVSTIARYEKVYLGVDLSIPEKIIIPFQAICNVEIMRLSYNDAWARDNTLLFVKKENQVRAVDFGFNAWGGLVDGLYQDYEKDNALGLEIIKHFALDYYAKKEFILEGGSFHTDGEGTLITTKACLLSEGRNPRYSLEEIETVLKHYLGIPKIIWLEHGIYEDETNEHVDNVACFLAPGVVLLAVTSVKEDIQYEYSKKNLEILAHATDARGRKLRVIPVEVPIDLVMTYQEAAGIKVHDNAKKRLTNSRLAASYVNFYQSKDFVICPFFNHPLDQQAFNILKNFYKEKEVIALPSREILLGGGNIHCVTMQIPKGEKS